MGWLEAIAVLVMIAIAAAGGFWASVVAQRKRARVRVPFVVGVLCGVMAGVALTARRGGLNTLVASTLRAVIGPRGPGTGLSAGGVVAGALTVAAALVRRGPAPLLDELRKRCLLTDHTQSPRFSRRPTYGTSGPVAKVRR